MSLDNFFVLLVILLRVLQLNSVLKAIMLLSHSNKACFKTCCQMPMESILTEMEHHN